MGTNFGRWSNWESAILAKCGDLESLLKEAKRRRREIDNDSEESDLVREAIVDFLRQRGENPDKAHVFLNIQEVQSCLISFRAGEMPSNRVKPYVEKQNVAELTHKRTNDGAGFVWRGHKVTNEKCRNVGCRLTG